MARRKAVFSNKQWEVTPCGLASLRTGAPYRYQIDAETLLATDNYDERRLYVWPLHVLRKPWVKADLFVEAFRAGIKAHKGTYPGEVDGERLEASLDEALRNIEQPRQARHPYRPPHFRRSDFPRRDRLVAYSLQWQAENK